MSKKIKIPKSVTELKMSPKKFAKEHNIKLKGKDVSKKQKKENQKRLSKEYSAHAIEGLNKAVQILIEHPDHKKCGKVKLGVENIITNSDVMKRIAKIYKKDPDEYPNLIYLPYMIMNTLIYYSSDSISDADKEIAKNIDKEALIDFCEKILKKKIKKYVNMGFSSEIAFQLATVIPTSKLFKESKSWYKKLLQQVYDIAEKSDINIDDVLQAVAKIDKKKGLDKKKILEGFYFQFILQKISNKQAKFNERQKELQEDLIEHALNYLNGLKSSKLRDLLKAYIKERKNAESDKNDNKRVIKFTDHANSNSPFTNIKEVVKDLIESNSNNELYLS